MKKLAKMLGKDFGWRVNAKAPNKEERQVAREQLKEANADRDRLRELRDKRCAAILAADEDYQLLDKAYKLARDKTQNLMGTLYDYKFTVGTSHGMYFLIKAQGDSWEDIFEKLAIEKRTR
jgi:hypothetical protein